MRKRWFFFNCWIFFFPCVTHLLLLKNGRKVEIFKLEASLSPVEHSYAAWCKLQVPVMGLIA